MKKKLIIFTICIILVLTILQIFINTVNANNTFQTDEKEKLNITTDLKTQKSIIEDYSTNNRTIKNIIEPYVPNDMLPLIMPRHIIGLDDRRKVISTTQFPYSTICYMKTVFQNGVSKRGTAFMISDNIAITAGHCIINSENGGPSSITLYPGKVENSNPFGSASAIRYTIPQDYADNFSVENDWAILVLDSNIRKQYWLDGIKKI